VLQDAGLPPFTQVKLSAVPPELQIADGIPPLRQVGGSIAVLPFEQAPIATACSDTTFGFSHLSVVGFIGDVLR
jgi:hypothetical protein